MSKLKNRKWIIPLLVILAMVLVLLIYNKIHSKYSKTYLDTDEYVGNEKVTFAEDIYMTTALKNHIVRDSRSPGYFVDNELLIYISSYCTESALQTLLEKYNAKIIGGAAIVGLYQIRFEDSYKYKELEHLIEELETSELIAHAYPNLVEEFNSNYIPNDTEYFGENAIKNYPDRSWHLKHINAYETWDYKDQMVNVNVGIMDTGFESTRDLTIKYSSKNDIKDTIENDIHHGVIVSSVIGAKFDNKRDICGVAPNSKLYGVSYVAESLKNYGFYTAEVMSLIKLVYADECKVINASYGNDPRCISASLGDKKALQSLQVESDILSEAITELLEINQFVICTSAGNLNDKLYGKVSGSTYKYSIIDDNKSNDESTQSNKIIKKGESCENIANAKFNNGFTYITDPIAKDIIIVVGSHDKSNRLAEFSTIGDRVDILAPGVNIYTIKDSSFLGESNGTSVSSPIVAGVATMMYGIDPTLKGSEIKNKIVSSKENRINAKSSVDKTLEYRNNKINELEQMYKDNRTFSSEYRVVLLIDKSGSMDGDSLDKLKESVSLFLESLDGTGIEVGLIAYSSAIDEYSWFTDDMKSLISLVSGLESGGSTIINSSLDECTAMLSYSEAENNIVILFSDGEIQGGYWSIFEKIRDVKSECSKLYAIGYPKEEKYRDTLKLIADTGCYFESYNIYDIVYQLNMIRKNMAGEKYIQIEIECPVDVKVSYNNEVLDSSLGNTLSSASFGTLEINPDRNSKVLRLNKQFKYDYDITITGYANGRMYIKIYEENDDNSEYSWDYSNNGVSVHKGDVFKLSESTYDKDHFTTTKVVSGAEQDSNSFEALKIILSALLVINFVIWKKVKQEDDYEEAKYEMKMLLFIMIVLTIVTCIPVGINSTYELSKLGEQFGFDYTDGYRLFNYTDVHMPVYGILPLALVTATLFTLVNTSLYTLIASKFNMYIHYIVVISALSFSILFTCIFTMNQDGAIIHKRLNKLIEYSNKQDLEGILSLCSDVYCAYGDDQYDIACEFMKYFDGNTKYKINDIGQLNLMQYSEVYTTIVGMLEYTNTRGTMLNDDIHQINTLFNDYNMKWIKNAAYIDIKINDKNLRLIYILEIDATSGHKSWKLYNIKEIYENG